MTFKPLTPPQTALVFLGVMAGLVLLGAATGWLMLWGFSATHPPPETTAVQAHVQTPPEPRLQVDPLADRQVMVGPDRLATTYGWTDHAQGRARTSVEAAMRLLAERGWPEPEAGE